MLNLKHSQGFGFAIKLLLGIFEMIIQLLTIENLCLKLTLQILHLRMKSNILTSEDNIFLTLLIKLLLNDRYLLQEYHLILCLVLQFLVTLLLELSAHRLVVFIDLFGRLMNLREQFVTLFGNLSLLLEVLILSFIKFSFMSCNHIFYLLVMTLDQSTLLLLKILIIALSLLDLMLKCSNLICMESFELFLILLLFLNEFVMFIFRILQFFLFLSELYNKIFVIHFKILYFIFKLLDFSLVLSSL